MGCPYVQNIVKDGVVTGGHTVCPECGEDDINTGATECKCMGCGHVLCGAVPKC